MAKKPNVVEAPPERLPEIIPPSVQGELVEPGDTATAIAEYRPTAAALAAMKEQLANKVWDLTTTKGNDEARQTRLQLVRLRTSLDAERKRLKQPHLDASRVIDDEAKRLTAEIESMEDPLDKLIKADENRREIERQEKEAAEKRRIQTQTDHIAAIGKLPLECMSCTIQELTDTIAGLQLQQVEDFDEALQPVAQQTIDQSLEYLRINLQAKQDAEAGRAEREAAEAKAKRDREIDVAIAQIAEWPVRAIGKKAAEIAGMLQAASTEAITAVQYGDRLQEALSIRAAAVNSVKEMHTTALASEAQAAELAALQDANAATQAAEAARIAKDKQITLQISGIRQHVLLAQELHSSEIAETMTRLQRIAAELDPVDYGDRATEVAQAISETGEALQKAYDRALAEEQAETARIEQELVNRQMRIENATLRDVVAGFLEWVDGDQFDDVPPDELVEMARASLAKEVTSAQAKQAVGS